MTDAELLDAARAARGRAYARYSNFSVGAALLCADDTVATGCNVENASYGLSMCAERVALFAAVAAGRRQFVTIAIAGPPHVSTPPCGACRQTLSEFGADLRVIYMTEAGSATASLHALLPARFELPAAADDELRTRV